MLEDIGVCGGRGVRERINNIVDKSRRLIRYLYLPLALIKLYKLKSSNLVLLHPTIYIVYYRHLLLKRGRPTPTY